VKKAKIAVFADNRRRGVVGPWASEDVVKRWL
jgi:hypothetical protein